MSNHRGPTSHVLTPDENRRGGSARTPAKKRASAENGRRHLLVMNSSDAARPWQRRGGREGNQVLTFEIRSKSGVKVNKQRWACGGCDRISTPMGLANHQLHTGHDGRTFIGYQDQGDTN